MMKQYGEGLMSRDDIASLFRGKDRVAIEALCEVYGGGVDETLDALFSLASRIAIAAECDPKLVAQGFQRQWQDVVDFLNEHAA